MGTRSRFLTALLGASLALPAFAGAASAAAGTTYWVDTDGMAGPANCAESTVASTTIQAAIDLTVSGDTVKVCPGTYVENLIISGYSGHSGITLKSVKPFAARIQSPDDQSGATIPNDLVAIYAANDVTIQWFHLAAKVYAACTDTNNVIDVLGGSQNAVIRSNRLRPTGPVTYNGPCALKEAIRVQDGSTAHIVYNLLKDWVDTGIGADGSAKAWINHNSLRTRHSHYTGGDCTGVAILSYGANVVVKNNQINEPVGSHVCAGTGVLIQGGKARITNNTVDGMFWGIKLDGAPTMAEVSGNRVKNTDQYRAGIYVTSTVSGANIHDNDASGNAGLACQDDSTGGGSFGTANTWTNNVGPNDSPDGICSAI